MAETLTKCGDDKQTILQCTIKLYSKETFLYKLLNTTLRNNDMSKVKTLGPLCVLLNSFLSRRSILSEEQTIYRGMTLTDEMIQEYREAVGTEIGWPAFTSTTKNRLVAEMFSGNTLCIIKLAPGLFLHGKDISDVSFMADEDEFLLSVGFMLRVDKVEMDETQQKHLIYLQSICHLV